MIATVDAHGRLSWGLVNVDGTLVYWESHETGGLRAKEFGVAGPWHPVSASANKAVYAAIMADIERQKPSAHADMQMPEIKEAPG